MKKTIFQSIMVVMMVFGAGALTMSNANTPKPPRPDKLEEIQSEKPSEYHSWVSGRWKWKRSEEQWQWREGKWQFDHDLYAFKNRYRYNNYYPYSRPRYYAIPIGRGYYRLVRLYL